MIKYLELALSQEVYEYLEGLDEMNWSARGNVLNQYLSNTSIGTTVIKQYKSPEDPCNTAQTIILTASFRTIHP
jgi:hypothetical protein